MKLTDFLIDVAPRGRKRQRMVIIRYGNVVHRDHLDTDSSQSRTRFLTRLAKKIDCEPAELALLDTAIIEAADGADDQAEADAAGKDREERRESQATRLINLARAHGLEFWHTPDKEPWATIPVRGHLEHWPVKSQTLRDYLGRLFYTATDGAANSQAVQDALSTFAAMALHDGGSYPVFLRVAEHDAKTYLDLGNESWQVVEIDERGWRLVDTSPVRFRRTKGMLPLPAPELGGNLDPLRQFITVDDDSWALILGWLVAALWPKGPYPLLCFSSEQGSGKSTRARMLRALIDPNLAPLRCEPRNLRDLAIAANNGRVIAFDNLSGLPVWLSDALCRLSTGGGFATRTLYANDEETIFDSQRPVIVTGIDDPIARGDLLDRALIVRLSAIPPSQRKTEAKLWADFTPLISKLLGCLLDAISMAMKRLPTITLSDAPRMADFAALVTAAEPALGLADGAFLRAYNRNRDDANTLALEASPVARFLVELVSAGSWTGTATELIHELQRTAGFGDDGRRLPRGWPTNGKAMAAALRRLAPNLRREGINVEFLRSGKARTVRLSRASDASDGCDAKKQPDSNERNGMAPDLSCTPALGFVHWEDGIPLQRHPGTIVD